MFLSGSSSPVRPATPSSVSPTPPPPPPRPPSRPKLPPGKPSVGEVSGVTAAVRTSDCRFNPSFFCLTLRIVHSAHLSTLPAPLPSPLWREPKAPPPFPPPTPWVPPPPPRWGESSPYLCQVCSPATGGVSPVVDTNDTITHFMFPFLS